MADSHGQVWMQVVAASSQDPDLFRGKAAQVEDQMIDVLQLGSEKQFPTRRLATVWRNERWKEMTTRWCETSIGRATFQISTWDRMISYRIDDVSEVDLGAFGAIWLTDENYARSTCLRYSAAY